MLRILSCLLRAIECHLYPPPPPRPAPPAYTRTNTHMRQVAPVVNYCQCDAARRYIVHAVNESGCIKVLGAFESVFCDGEVEDWGKDLLEDVAQDCSWLDKWRCG